jgi:hypothetical protein
MEILMRALNKICMSALMLGAVAIAAPAMAQAEDEAAATADTSAGNQASSANTQTAMNSSSVYTSTNVNASTLGDTSKKYHRATRGKDFRAEQKITEQLNQMASADSKSTQTAAL